VRNLIILSVAVSLALLPTACGGGGTQTANVKTAASTNRSSAPARQRGRPVSGKITVRATETLSPQDVTNGGVAGTGHSTISGAITDAGAATDYRTVKGTKVLIRRVVVGKKGRITFLITLYTTAPPTALGHWTITSATGTYKGLHGSGDQTVDNYTSVPATFALAGTVSQ
jgi:hypothetical protein